MGKRPDYKYYTIAIPKTEEFSELLEVLENFPKRGRNLALTAVIASHVEELKKLAEAFSNDYRRQILKMLMLSISEGKVLAEESFTEGDFEEIHFELESEKNKEAAEKNIHSNLASKNDSKDDSFDIEEVNIDSGGTTEEPNHRDVFDTKESLHDKGAGTDVEGTLLPKKEDGKEKNPAFQLLKGFIETV